MWKWPPESVMSEPNSSSCSQSTSKARTRTLATGVCVSTPFSQTVTRPQTTHTPKRPRIRHQRRCGRQYSQA